MRTVVENGIGLSENYSSSRVTYKAVEEVPSENRSCFYDFGAKHGAKFCGYVSGRRSSFVEQLNAEFSN